MRILFIGGTRFVGLHMAREAVARGHEVTLFHRTEKVLPGLDAASHIYGDRDTDLSALSTGEWDAVVDVCAYRPAQVDAVARVVRARSFVLVSTVSVYSDAVPPHSTESAELADTAIIEDVNSLMTVVDGTTYGPLKVLCEQAAVRHFADALIIRPTYVIGPDDYTDRFTKYVHMIRAGGVVVVPEPREMPWQYIDVRDLAAFTISAIEQGLTGPFHTAAPSGGITFEQMLAAIVETEGSEAADLAWISTAEAEASDTVFPFWAGTVEIGALQLDTSKAVAAGLQSRPLADSIRSV